MASYPPIKHIFHPTDLTAGSAVAFLHALRIALATRAALTIMHVSDTDEIDWSDLPGVRSTLAKWGYLKDENDMAGLYDLGVGVKKVVAESKDPVQACMDYLERHPTDLVVLATHQSKGRMGWLRDKVAEPLSRGAGEPTLFVPGDTPGFVEAGSGRIAIRNILIPVAHEPHPAPALQGAMRVAEQLAGGEVVFTLLHIGPSGSGPALVLPEYGGWTWKQESRQGDVVETILEVEKEIDADLIVMTTKGHDGFLDALRGSTTERVLRGATCPVLAGMA